MRRFSTFWLAAAIAAAPAAAKADPAPPAEDSAPPRLEGEAIGYLAVPALLVLVFLIGLAVGGGDEMPESP